MKTQAATAEQLAAFGAPPHRFRLLSADDLAALPPLRWRIRGVLPETGLAAVFGPPTSGKSFLALDFAMALSEGREWFGNRVSSCNVVYCALEGEAGIRGRVAAYRMRNETTGAQVRFLVQPFDLRNPTHRAALVAAIRAEGGAGVVILDTLNRAAPGIDENESRDMGDVIAAAKALQAEIGGLVILVHHTGKNASNGMRGHSSLHAALDAAIEVTRDNGRRKWSVYKSKDGADGATQAFRLDVIKIGSDEEDGEDVTSCVVVPEADAGEAVRRAKVPSGGNQKIVWDALGELFRSAGTAPPPGAPKELPPGRPCVKLEEAIEKCRGRLTCEEKRQMERTQVAITGLVNRGCLMLRDGWLWCA